MQARTARTTRGVAALTRITSNEVGSDGVGAGSTSGGVGGGTSAAGAGGTATGAHGRDRLRARAQGHERGQESSELYMSES